MFAGMFLKAGLSELAVGWGYVASYEWRFDLGFQRSLGLEVLFG